MQAEIGEITKLGRPSKPCRHCQYQYTVRTCLCCEADRREPYCPRCGCPSALPINK